MTSTSTISEQVILIILGIICVILNSTEIVLIIKKRKSMKTFEMILLSFAVADVIVGLVNLFYAAYDIEYKITRASHGPIEYVIFTMQYFAVCSSIAHVLGINVERLLAVKFPLGHQRCKSPKNARRIIAIIWFVAIVLTVATVSQAFIRLSMYGMRSFDLASLYVFAVTILFFGIIFIGIHSYVIWKVIIQSKQFNQRFYGSTNTQTANLQALSRAARERTLVFTCVMSIMAYVGCTYPAAGISIYVVAKDQQTASRSSLMNFWIGFLLLINSALDPFVYFLKGYLENLSRQKATSGIPLSNTA